MFNAEAFSAVYSLQLGYKDRTDVELLNGKMVQQYDKYRLLNARTS